jgi:alkanesulfonate monooxygenase SsuD/methylene tetrahydromethanopterin reductase-like flavin-dependent oxidoreductase (luciferase family)
MHRALFVPPFGELADPRLLADLAHVAEDTGWDGFFLWDHMWRPDGKPIEVSDAWICMAAIASSTARLRIGPMVTPLARRRPQKVARESVALDYLSNGRLTLGVGLGVDTGGELGRFGEQVDERRRGDMLDEALALLLELWSGDAISFRGAHFTADDVRFLPTPLQKPRIPIWVAARGGSSTRPIRRASRFDGLFPVGASAEQLEAMLRSIKEERGSLDGFDVAMIEEPESDVEVLANLGVTWLLRSIGEGKTAERARELISKGPA